MTDLPVSFELLVDGLGCDRGAVPIFRDISFHLHNGQALQLFGANGSGKSTILQVVAGLVPRCAGRMKWRGSEELRDSIPSDVLVYQGHETGLKAALTVRENLSYWARLYRSSAILNCIETVGLTDLADQPVRLLSAGQKRRAGLARCLLAGRPLWLLDEPTATLDDDGHALVETLVANHLANGNIAIIATHDPLDIASLQMRLEPSVVS